MTGWILHIQCQIMRAAKQMLCVLLYTMVNLLVNSVGVTHLSAFENPPRCLCKCRPLNTCKNLSLNTSHSYRRHCKVLEKSMGVKGAHRTELFVILLGRILTSDLHKAVLIPWVNSEDRTRPTGCDWWTSLRRLWGYYISMSQRQWLKQCVHRW